MFCVYVLCLTGFKHLGVQERAGPFGSEGLGRSRSPALDLT